MAIHRLTGFTLIELLIAVCVAGVLVAVAVPSFGSMLRNAQLTRAAGPAHTALFRARSEAVKFSRDITVCPLAPNDACGTDWTKGLMVFVDSNQTAGETVAVRDDTDSIISVGQPIPDSVSMSVFASDDRTAAGQFTPHFISFSAHGQSSWQNGSVVFCDDRGALHARVINVLLTGDIQTGRTSNDTPVDVFGRDVDCS